MPDVNLPNVSIGAEGRKVREKFRKLKADPTFQKATETGKLKTEGGPAPPSIANAPREEHYHLSYQQGEHAFVHFAVSYPTQRQAYLEVKRLGDESEPNTEWYDDGRVLIETPLQGRTGLYQIIVRVAACIRKDCARSRSPLVLPRRAHRPVGKLLVRGRS